MTDTDGLPGEAYPEPTATEITMEHYDRERQIRIKYALKAAADAERAAIVAWLLGVYGDAYAADAIERGEHHE